MSKPIISIIIPVYNVEKYLQRCLDSIVTQTFTDWECILVDDGSLDNSGKICDEYAEKDRRFKVFHLTNSGVSVARNKGLDEANGEWINFVDSDDWIEKETYEKSIECAVKEKVDIVCYGLKIFKNGQYKKVPFKEKNDIFFKFQHYRMYMHSPCNKLIRREVIGDRKYIVGMKVCEDLLFIFDVFTTQNIRIFYNQNHFYNYNRENELSSTFLPVNKQSINDLECVYKYVERKCEEKSWPKSDVKEYICFLRSLAAMPYICILDFFNPDKFRSICEKWYFFSYNPKYFIPFLFAYLKLDFLVKYYCKVKAVVKRMRAAR